MNADFLFGAVIPVLGIAFVIFVFVWTMKKSIKAEEEMRQKLRTEVERFEAQKLSKKLKDSRVEIAVKKPQSFKTKRKPQKQLDK